MMYNNYTWILNIPMVLMIIFCLIAMIIVLSRPTAHNRCKSYVMIALGILLACQFVAPLLSAYVNRWGTTDNLILLHGITSLIFTLARMSAIGLLIAAAFIDRDPHFASSSAIVEGTPLADRPNDNPYASPKQ